MSSRKRLATLDVSASLGGQTETLGIVSRVLLKGKMNTYTKLRDGWGVRATEPVTAGQTVQVQTQAGAIKTEVVSKVLWQGKDKHTGQTVYLLAIAPKRSSGRFRSDDGGPRGHKPCYMCGSYYCEGARGHLCQDD